MTEDSKSVLDALNPWMPPPPAAPTIDELAVDMMKELRALVIDVADDRDAREARRIVGQIERINRRDS